MTGWYFDPHNGGDKIPPDVQEKTQVRIMAHAKRLKPDKANCIKVRFKGQFCYIDEAGENNGRDMPLCRLRYFANQDRFSLGFYAYSSDRYEPCMFGNGWFGTPEEALEIGMVYVV